MKKLAEKVLNQMKEAGPSIRGGIDFDNVGMSLPIKFQKKKIENRKGRFWEIEVALSDNFSSPYKMTVKVEDVEDIDEFLADLREDIKALILSEAVKFDKSIPKIMKKIGFK